ncbi:unnamed protein product [Rotaria sp. Silwood1]|nr:unnamed protein product [Rotaria sp. Silwood1]CAF1509541.1 unnamed protein product [Rotaria sp. Silwood1]CAF3599723.1 unnamed protein product [Rotaria sp. Silwood1]CAF3622322.1 unnamed protein product [Rotaria sp. Silwood1]CAF3628238.1 unnamed protein product [Rotaria sp. Silwood1]
MNIFTCCVLCVLCTVIVAKNFNEVAIDHGGHEQINEKEYRCIAQCSFSVSFDQLSPFFLPQQCQTRFQNSVCHVELNIDYESRTVSGAFDSHGDHGDMSDGIKLEPGMEMEVRETTYNFQRKQVLKATWIIFCATNDECDRNYMDIHLLEIIQNKTWNMFDKISSLIFSPSSKNLQCYMSETMVQNCTNGDICRYNRNPQFNAGKPDYHCQSSLTNQQMIFFQTHRSKTSATFSTDLKRYDILNYVCNIDNCNSPIIATEIGRLINLEVEKDTINSSNTFIFDTKMLFTLFFGLFFVIFA